MSDEQLIQGLRNRNAEAFREVVESYQRRVVNICYRFVQDRSEAEDLAQDTFIEIYRSVDRFRGESELSTWIFRIAVSKSLDHLRKQSRSKRGGGLRLLFGLDEYAAEVPAPASTEPDSVLAQQERRIILNRALSQLPENQRIAFVLSQYDGINYQEIAKIMKTTLEAVESLIHRARKNLQRILRDHYEKYK